MATSKKPRKKYRGLGRKADDAGIRRLVLTHLESMPKNDDGSDPFKAEVKGCPNLSEPAVWHIVNQATTKPRGWIMSVFAIYDDGSGQYVEEEEIIVRDAVLFTQLQDTFLEAYERVQNAGNPNHLKDYGWVARPYTKKLELKIRKSEEIAA